MKLIILDRDGTINEDSDEYIKSPQEWIPVPGSLEAIGRLCRANYQVVIATNQSGIARGLYDMDMLTRIHNKMLSNVREHGGEISGIFFCPHGPDDDCQCRKPRAGLFSEIKQAVNAHMASTYSVGDSERDILATREAGALPVLVRTGKGEKTLNSASPEILEGVPVFDDLAAFTDRLLSGKLKTK